ncbi:MAG: type II secretion system protein [Planctomycetes bacterium]|nr:type II secretion system protein [Planctomycetota bacterium]MCB9935714.1 type II secretion system protein [Planctomycetota bacterium]
MRRYRSGFTLIEILVVVGIIVLLAAVLLVSFSGVFSKSKEAQTKATIETLKSNVESFQSRWGPPPPCSLQELGQLVGYPALTEPNQDNVGIEALVLALRSRKEQGPYLDGPLFQDDKRRVNLDLDTVLEDATLPENLDIEEGSSRDLFEIADAWGNPLVYLDIKTVRAGNFQYEVTLADGSSSRIDPTECQNALRHPVTGQYPTGYVIWSFGEDGINQYGLGDDITSWPKYE